MLVTGAASGIGEAIAHLFHEEGAALALIDRDEAALVRVCNALGAFPVPLDLADTGAIGSAVQRAAQAMGGLDGIVNCAALAEAVAIEDMDDALVLRFHAVNMIAPYVICREALPYLRRSPGATIVNIASGQGLLPNAPKNTAYASTKGGLIAFSKSLAAELAPAIRVNAVCPGITNTPLVAPFIAGFDDPADAPFVQQYAMRRLAEPIEIARAVLFLSCSDSSYITGTAMAVDGGRTFH